MPLETRVRRAEDTLLAVVASTAADAVAVPIHAPVHAPVHAAADGPALSTPARDLASHAGVDVAALLAGERAEGAVGEVIAFPLTVTGRYVRGLLVGVGDGSLVSYRRAGAALARKLRGASTAALSLGFADEPGSDGDAGRARLREFAEGLLLASYTFTLSAAGENAKAAPVGDVVVSGNEVAEPSRLDAGLETATISARAVALARDLVNMPASTKSPQWLAEQAERAAAESGLGARVRAEHELDAEGFGGILAVGAGSARPPRLIELTYEPERARGHIVLIGKGITFDSGGLSLKPNDNMKLMKTDMAGGGAVLGAMSALRDLRVPVRVTGLIAAAENMPSGSAQRPGDVISHYGGRSVEVFNTDAEGRLVLADALAYARDSLDADAIVDLATLTGAATVALGRTHGALYATDDDLAGALAAAGDAGGDRLWRMPLVADYRDALDSDIADLAHIARVNYSGGSVIAALFLREFVGDVPWAHLDIAGPARAMSDEHEVTKGGTGFGVRALLRWLAAAPG